jgi:hypothetical protein
MEVSTAREGTGYTAAKEGDSSSSRMAGLVETVSPGVVGSVYPTPDTSVKSRRAELGLY